MSEPSAAVQKAIYETLTGGSPQAVSCPVYDAVPQNSPFPYVVIDGQEVVPQEPLSERMDVRFVYLSIWSRYRGQKEVLDIISELDAALHNKRFSMDTGRMVWCRMTRKHTIREPDGATFMGEVTLKIITEH